MEQLSDVTYRDERWHAPPALAGATLERDGVAAGPTSSAGGRTARARTEPIRELPVRGGPERGRKRHNTVSRWDGGTGVPGQSVTAAGQTARAEGAPRGGGDAV